MFILILISIFTLFGSYLWLVARKYSHLPGLLGSEFPIIGNLYQSLRYLFMSSDDIQAFFEKIFAEGGGICVVWMFHLPVLAISDPLILEKIIEHPASVDKEPLIYENVPNLWKGTFTYACADNIWKKRRKIINQSLKKQNLINYHNTFVKMSKRMVGKMAKETGPFSPERYPKMATLDSILETHFGCDLNTQDNNELLGVLNLGKKCLEKSFFDPVFGFFFNLVVAVSNIVKPFNEMLEVCIKKTLDKGHNITERNVMEDESNNLYIETVLQQYLSGDTNDKEMKQVMNEMILVGSHTVSESVNAALIFLATLPEIQEKVWQEQQSIFGDSDRDITLEDLKRMDYLDRVFKEVLRFVSGAILSRKTKAEINIDGQIIPAKTTILICSRIMRMDSHYWENPSKFDPDRYLRNEPSKSYKHAFSFFGYGIRNCPGSQYAYNEGKIMISTVIRRFKLTSDRRFEDLKLSTKVMMEVKEEGKKISIVKRK